MPRGYSDSFRVSQKEGGIRVVCFLEPGCSTDVTMFEWITDVLSQLKCVMFHLILALMLLPKSPESGTPDSGPTRGC